MYQGKPKPITAAVSYVASSSPANDGMLRQLADAKVKEILAAKVVALASVKHEFSPALPRDPCHFKPVREWVASAEIFVFTRQELEMFIEQQKTTDNVVITSSLD